MSEYTINDLRADLAATIRSLRNGDEKMTIEKAKAIGELAQTMINSAKVEVDMLRAVGAPNLRPTGFVQLTHEADAIDGEGRKEPTALPESTRPKPHVRQAVGSAPRASL